MLNPQSVAIVGISQAGRFGGILYDNIVKFGYEGGVYGVNPRYETLYDRPCYPSLSDLPERPDCALLAVPNARLIAAVEEAAACRIPALVIYANAYSEGVGGMSLREKLREVVLANDLVVCGPNCMGFIVPGHKLPTSGFAVDPQTPVGNVSLISHSGSVWECFVQNQRGVAFNYIISSGGEMVTTVADYMQFALSDESTKVIGLFLETVRDPETFTAALAEAANRDIPVVVLKTGRSVRGAQLAAAHSGALAGEDGAYNAIFEYYGVRRVVSLDEMMDALEVFSSGMRPSTRYLSAILDSGGERALMVDLAETEGVEFTPIGEDTQAELSEVLDEGLDPVNPLDVWGTGGEGALEIFKASLLALDSDPATGLNVMAVDCFPLDEPHAEYLEVATETKDRLRNPLLFIAHLSAGQGPLQPAGMRKIGVPVLMGTETGLRACAHLLDYGEFQRDRAERGNAPRREVPVPADLSERRSQLRSAAAALDEHASKQLLEAYGLTTTCEIVAGDLDAVLRAGNEIGYPLVLKTLGDLHKTESDGVRLNLATADDLSAAYRDFEARLGPRVLVQKLIPAGVELILGIVDDAQFGPMMTLGMGGILVELMKDVRMLALPTTPEAVRRALSKLRGAALLDGFRGRAAADIDAAVGAAMGLSALAIDLGDLIAEIDVNPLIVLPEGAVVADALVVPKGPPPAASESAGFAR